MTNEIKVLVEKKPRRRYDREEEEEEVDYKLIFYVRLLRR